MRRDLDSRSGSEITHRSPRRRVHQHDVAANVLVNRLLLRRWIPGSIPLRERLSSGALFRGDRLSVRANGVWWNLVPWSRWGLAGRLVVLGRILSPAVDFLVRSLLTHTERIHKSP